MNPYRKVVAERTISAMSRVGKVTLRVEPNLCRLTVGARMWTIRRDHLSIHKTSFGRVKTRTVKLEGRLLVSRSWPTRESALWLERPAGKKGVAIVERLVGLPPVSGMEEASLSHWRNLETLTTQLAACLAESSQGVKAIEFGRGQHRVLLTESRGLASIYARPVFRERPRLAATLSPEGILQLCRGKKDARVFKILGGLQTVATGDRIQFCHRDGQEVGALFLPWVGKAEREELTRRLQAFGPGEGESLAAAGKAKTCDTGQDSEGDSALNRRLRTQTNPG